MTTRAKYFRSLTYKTFGINTETAGIIYKTICRPLLEYAHPLFMNCRKNTIKTIQTAETTALRCISKLRHPQNPMHNPPNNLLYEKTKTKPIQDRLEELNKKFAKRPHNIDILTQMCIRRTSDTSRYRNPQKTILQHIQESREHE